MRRFFFGWFMLYASLSGCVSTTSDGESEIGGSEESPVILRRAGLGIFFDEKTLTAGWLSETRIIVPKGRCQVVIISKQVEEVKRLVEVVGSAESINNICVIKDAQ